jgi:hypothetical protein
MCSHLRINSPASLVSLELLVGLLLAVFLDATYSILVSTPSHCWALYRNWTPLEAAYWM